MSREVSINRECRRPQFISSSEFRAWMRGSEINKKLRVDGILPTSYAARCKRLGRPIRSKSRWGQQVFRPIDVVSRARAEGLDVAPSKLNELRSSYKELLLRHETLAKEVAGFEETLKFKIGSDWLSTLNAKGLLTEKQIIDGSMPRDGAVTGVYFLIRKTQVIYVGQAKNVHHRISAHGNFDRWSFLPCEPAQLDVIESLYIHWLQPERNGRYASTGRIYAPMTLDRIAELAGSASKLTRE